MLERLDGGVADYFEGQQFIDVCCITHLLALAYQQGANFVMWTASRGSSLEKFYKDRYATESLSLNEDDPDELASLFRWVRSAHATSHLPHHERIQAGW